MATSRPLRLAPEWDDRFTRMVGLSALGHALVLVAVVLLVGRLGGRPLPMVAYTVELTDPSALGGRLPPGAPKADLSGGSAAPLPAAPPPKAEPAEPAKAPEPPTAPAARPGGPPGREEAAPHDAYGAAAERWRQRVGGGLGGNDGGSGPIGSGGEGKGGGGQLVGLEFIAYRQQVINTIKAQWTNVLARPGMVAAVRFEIAPDGQVSNVRLAQSSGNPAYDASAMRAVQHVGQLPPPPARCMSEFHEFVIEFHSEESGGRGAG